MEAVRGWVWIFSGIAHLSSEIKGKFCHRLCTSSVKHEIRHFHVIVVE